MIIKLVVCSMLLASVLEASPTMSNQDMIFSPVDCEDEEEIVLPEEEDEEELSDGGDEDGDGIPNGLEIVLGLNPLIADSDGDGIDDLDDLDDIEWGRKSADLSRKPPAGDKAGKTPWMVVWMGAEQASGSQRLKDFLFRDLYKSELTSMSIELYGGQNGGTAQCGLGLGRNQRLIYVAGDKIPDGKIILKPYEYRKFRGIYRAELIPEEKSREE